MRPRLSDLTNILAHPLAYPATLAGTDLRTFVAELDGLFRDKGARSQALPLDLAFRQGRLPTAAIATLALESDTVARAVLTHVRVAPFYAGVSLAVHPNPDLDAPMLVADVNIPPPGFTRVFLDACGAAEGSPTFKAEFAPRLSPIVERAARVDRDAVPAWFAPVAGGAGGRLRASAGNGHDALRVLVRYVGAYLDALAMAPRASSEMRENARTQRAAVVRAVRANGPAGKYLTRAFDAAFAESLLARLWNVDGDARAS